MISTETLERHIAAIHEGLKELKADVRELRTDFQADVLRIDNDIKDAVSKLQDNPRVRRGSFR